MLHVVPILCLILFIGLVEYRLKEHLNETDKRISKLAKLITSYVTSESNQKEKKSNENSSNE